ncbi:phage head closure protein [Fervidibacillus albus]|uniref:Phage head closure protein n=1 Tax=Fervidibacillus albus TaxID=2980026 RepID=A0A9E8LWZ9_9BACI|nr:phage head closure protein [Fervidibacillus albus]WAA10329.1 phage head closure protein [Fervidibacillus albus]
MRSTPIFLIYKVIEENELGDVIHKDEIKREILAEKKSIRQSEFYQAAGNGLKPELTFIIWPHEYQGETIVEYGKKRYKVIRVYEKNTKELELICEGLVNQHAGS